MDTVRLGILDDIKYFIYCIRVYLDNSNVTSNYPWLMQLSPANAITAIGFVIIVYTNRIRRFPPLNCLDELHMKKVMILTVRTNKWDYIILNILFHIIFYKNWIRNKSKYILYIVSCVDILNRPMSCESTRIILVPV